jgi:hypothetical protein
MRALPYAVVATDISILGLENIGKSP